MEEIREDRSVRDARDTLMLKTINDIRAGNVYDLVELVAKTAIFEENAAFRSFLWDKFVLGLDADGALTKASSLKPQYDLSLDIQVQLEKDIKRSFNHISEGQDIQQLRDDLREVLIHFFRCQEPNNPSTLEYYQGFHDIAEVLILSFGKDRALEYLLVLAETHLREYMLPGFFKTIDFVNKIVETQDKKIYDVFHGRASYGSVAWVISWFRHEVDDFKISLKIFNFLIMLPPAAVVYLSAALVLSPKGRELILNQEDPELIFKMQQILPKDLDPAVLFPQTLSLMAQQPPTLILGSMGAGVLPSHMQDLPKDLTLQVFAANSTYSYYSTIAADYAGYLNPTVYFPDADYTSYLYPSSYLSSYSEGLASYANYLNPANYSYTTEKVEGDNQATLALGMAAASIFASWFSRPADPELVEEKE